MKNYHWPGNVRELQHAVERSVILSDSNKLQLEDFFLKSHDTSFKSETEAKTLEQMEKQFIADSLYKNDGNVTQTAKVLGLTRTALYRRLNKYGLMKT